MMHFHYSLGCGPRLHHRHGRRAAAAGLADPEGTVIIAVNIAAVAVLLAIMTVQWRTRPRYGAGKQKRWWMR